MGKAPEMGPIKAKGKNPIITEARNVRESVKEPVKDEVKLLRDKKFLSEWDPLMAGRGEEKRRGDWDYGFS